MLIQKYTPVSEEEYLRLEAQSPIRHEYVRGEMFAMTGGTLRHNVIVGNLYSALRAHLRSTGCRAFMNDVRVRANKHHAYYYPDVMVSCGPGMHALDAESSTVEDPVLIVEVLSASTEGTDRREKLLAYRTIDSMIEYVLVSQDRHCVEIHRRRGDIAWERIEYAGVEPVHLASVDLTLELRAIYEGVPV